MTPEAQIMIQATGYLMMGIHQIIALLSVAFTIAMSIGFIKQLETVVWSFRWGDYWFERAMGWLVLIVYTIGLVAGVKVLFF